MIDSHPDWFKEALAVNKEQRNILVEGNSIHYQKWGDDSKPGMVLVHGSGSHSHWWDFIAPLLLEEFQVSAIDLSGMGDSGHREDYSLSSMAKRSWQLQKIVVFLTTEIRLFAVIAWEVS